jgi:hypothetical protein
MPINPRNGKTNLPLFSSDLFKRGSFYSSIDSNIGLFLFPTEHVAMSLNADSFFEMGASFFDVDGRVPIWDDTLYHQIAIAMYVP